MNEKMKALTFRETWELVLVPTDAVVVSCRWIFALKYRLDGSVDKYKVRLVAKSYTWYMVSTILRRSRQLPGWTLSGLCSLLLLTCH